MNVCRSIDCLSPPFTPNSRLSFRLIWVELWELLLLLLLLCVLNVVSGKFHRNEVQRWWLKSSIQSGVGESSLWFPYIPHPTPKITPKLRLLKLSAEGAGLESMRQVSAALIERRGEWHCLFLKSVVRQNKSWNSTGNHHWLQSHEQMIDSWFQNFKRLHFPQSLAQ